MTMMKLNYFLFNLIEGTEDRKYYQSTVIKRINYKFRTVHTDHSLKF